MKYRIFQCLLILLYIFRRIAAFLCRKADQFGIVIVIAELLCEKLADLTTAAAKFAGDRDHIIGSSFLSGGNRLIRFSKQAVTLPAECPVDDPDQCSNKNCCNDRADADTSETM